MAKMVVKSKTARNLEARIEDSARMAKDKVVRDKTAKDKVVRDKTAKDKAVRDKMAKDKAVRRMGRDPVDKNPEANPLLP